MKTPRILITIAAVALLAQATAVAQPTKFRAPHERGADERPALSVNAPESNALVRHQHRSGGGSPRTVRADGARTQDARAVIPAPAAERDFVRVGPRSKSRDIARPADPSTLRAAPTGSPRRVAGPPSKRSGRR